ncbi:MAG: hypothetical protein WC700_10255 [Gemmatimonadaceae bacterium]|jgi:hypothetical protein
MARAYLLQLARRIERRSRKLATTHPDLALLLLVRAEALTAAALGADDDRCLAGLAWLGVEVRP